MSEIAHRRVNWIELSVLLKHTSKSIRNNDDDLENNIISSIHNIMLLAKENDIDLNLGWKRWKVKVERKYYVSDK